MTDTAPQNGSKAKRSAPRLTVHGVWRTTAALPALTITAPAEDVMRKPVRALAGKVGQDKERSQFYTRPDLARRYYRSFRKRFDPSDFQMVEPGAGRGAFLALLPIGSFGCDVEPMCAGIYTADFLTLGFNSGRPIACLGNPPFGRSAKLAIRFFNHAASYSEVIAFIVPKTFRKTATINLLDPRFHLIHEESVPADAFLFRGMLRSVSTVFQIWVRLGNLRPQLPDVKTHSDFKFTSPEDGDFAIQRVGKRAGRVHDEMWRSARAHYFIKGSVEAAMKALAPAFAKAAQNTAGQPSLAKSEIVSLYSRRTSAARRRREAVKPTSRERRPK